MRAPGDILLVSCYEPGYQPSAIASPAAFLRAAGYAPLAIDLAVEELDGPRLERLARARLVAISAPMHTAMSLALRVARRLRAENQRAHVCFFGLYAALNRALLQRPAAEDDARPLADTIFGSECEEELVGAGAAAGGGRERRRRCVGGAAAAPPAVSGSRSHPSCRRWIATRA